MPKEPFKREVEKELKGRETERGRLSTSISTQIPDIEQAGAVPEAAGVGSAGGRESPVNHLETHIYTNEFEV